MTEHRWGTAATASAGSGGAPVVYLPGATPLSDAEPVAVSLESESLSGAFIDELRHESDAADRADAMVLRKMMRSGMSQREVERALAQELDHEQVFAAVQRYIRLGYIDDDRLAEQIVRTQAERKGAGSAGIRRELDARGIPSEVVARACESLDDDSEFDRACRLAAERLRRLSSESSEVQQRRVMAFLLRRGYSASLALRAIQHARIH